MRVAIGLLTVIACAGVARANPAPDDDRHDICDEHENGARVDLDTKAAPVADVLRLLADAGGLSLVISSDIQGTETIHVHQQPWNKLACAVGALHGLIVERQGTVLLVRAR